MFVAEYCSTVLKQRQPPCDQRQNCAGPVSFVPTSSQTSTTSCIEWKKIRDSRPCLPLSHAVQATSSSAPVKGAPCIVSAKQRTEHVSVQPTHRSFHVASILHIEPRMEKMTMTRFNLHRAARDLSAEATAMSGAHMPQHCMDHAS